MSPSKNLPIEYHLGANDAEYLIARVLINRGWSVKEVREMLEDARNCEWDRGDRYEQH